MLNYKGRYYTKAILNDLTKMRDNLCNLNILKTKDLGENMNLASLSASISTDFISTDFSSIVVNGYSQNIKDYFYYMGEENLVNIPEANKYFEDLKKIYENNSINKAYEYYKLFRRYYCSVTSCLKEALVKAERGEGVPIKRKGASFSFDTSLDNVSVLSTVRDDYSKMGLRLPNGEGKFVQIDGNDMYRSKTTGASATNPSNVNVSVVVNIPYNDEKEISKKIYPVVSTYKGKTIEIVGMISASELIEVLKENYGATASNILVDMEPFYEQAEKISRQSLQSVVYFVTGKSKVYRVIDCQKLGEWPNGIVKSDFKNATLLTSRGLTLARARKDQAARKAA